MEFTYLQDAEKAAGKAGRITYDTQRKVFVVSVRA